MRYLPLFLLLVACSDAPTRDELVTANRSIVALGEEMRAMRSALGAADHDARDPEMLARVDRLDAQLAALTGRMASMEAATAKGRKQLHLVVRESGEDLGVSVDGALAAWNEEHQVVVDYRTPRGSYWNSAKCDGGIVGFDPNSNPELFFNRYVFLPNDILARAISTGKSFTNFGSYLTNSGECLSGAGGPAFPAITAGFSLPRFSPDLLDVRYQ